MTSVYSPKKEKPGLEREGVLGSGEGKMQWLKAWGNLFGVARELIASNHECVRKRENRVFFF